MSRESPVFVINGREETITGEYEIMDLISKDDYYLRNNDFRFLRNDCDIYGHQISIVKENRSGVLTAVYPMICGAY